jgi:hypothetical protein
VSFLITADHLARQVNPHELSELVLDGIDQHSELIVWGNVCSLRVLNTVLRFLTEKRFGNWIGAMVRAKSRPNEITEEVNHLFYLLGCLISHFPLFKMQAEINDCLQALDNDIIPQRVLQASLTSL